MNWRIFWEKQGLRRLLIHGSILLGLFILISFIIGPVIVPGPLLYTLGFFVYGGLGYILLAMAIFFVVLARNKLLRVPTPAKPLYAFGVLAAALLAGFYTFGMYVKANPALAEANPVGYGIALHALFLGMFLALGFALFTPSYAKRFVLFFKRELIICTIVGLVFYASMRFVWLSWPYLSWAVGKVVFALLSVFPGNPVLLGPQTIKVGSFAVLIGEACSGVFSIFLFTSLFLLIVGLDWKLLRHWRAVILFIATVIGLFFVNVLRVYLIILVGYFYDPDFAVNLFHSYVGMVLFMAYFIAFLYLFYDWMRKPSAISSAAKRPKKGQK